MAERDGEDSEVERLARNLNEGAEALGEAVGCVGRGCLWAVLGFLALELGFLVIGGSFEALAGRIGPWPALLIFVALGWLGVRAWRRHRAGSR